MSTASLRGPVLLDPANFTPLARTPWAGARLARTIKADVASDPCARIGESWEFSCDPALPSKVSGTEMTLAALIAHDPAAALSPKQAALTGGQSEILVKLLDADEPLSLQVHPRDGDSALKAHECGKPESWLVLAAEPGAGLYMGFSRAMDVAELRRLLADGAKAKDVLHFVPVKAGDYFEIEAGVPHAIGRGVTLLEPQRIVAGRSGKTYRMWDWGRRYDEKGVPDPERGKPRELHVEESLALVEPRSQVGEAFVATLRRAPSVRSHGRVTVTTYPANPYYQVHVLELDAKALFELRIADGYGAMVVLDGELASADTAVLDRPAVRMPKGQPALLPHAAMPLALRAPGAACRFAVVTPAGARLEL